MKSDPYPVDEAIALIADYVEKEITSPEALQTARYCLADTLGCGILALQFHECTKLLGPVVPGTIVPNGARVPGTSYVLDPIRAAFNIGTMIRWLDFNDTWLAAEWGHPSDNLGGLLAITDYLSQVRLSQGKAPFTVKDLLVAMVKAHEIQGNLALLNSFNRVGFDHVIFVKVATTAVVAHLLGANREQLINAISQAWVDVGPLRTYRHQPNVGSRKSWAAGDATSRGVMLAMMTMQGEMGYPQPLSAPIWGLYDVLFKGKPFEFQRPLGSYVMENVLFKISFPAEFHAQTAVECALKLHTQVKDRLAEIELIHLETHESALRIIDKRGPLTNSADRDHCLQYMAAIGLIYGELTANHYEQEIAHDPRIDALRDKMVVVENDQYSRDYLDPETRSIANAMQVTFKDGSRTERVAVEYPLGHRRRRQEAIPFLFEKLTQNLSDRFSSERVEKTVALFKDKACLEGMSVPQLVDLFLE